jgi:rhomboid protease GluP
MQPTFSRLTAEKAHTYSLVLSAVGIAHRVRRQGSVWSIAVWSTQRAAAVEAIALYLRENPPHSTRDPSLLGSGARTFSAFYVSAILILIYFLIRPDAELERFASAFGADAARIMAGELYRCTTALLLHADIAHLLGNVAGLMVFGTVTASRCGWGLGWAMILAAGIAGNWVTAWWYGGHHLSIGASTGVFGAVGICTALSLWHSRLSKNSSFRVSWRRWVPFAGGLALLGILGTAPQADLMAHLSGFASGLALGGIGAKLSGRLPFDPPVGIQWFVALAAGALVAGCWLKGMTN